MSNKAAEEAVRASESAGTPWGWILLGFAAVLLAIWLIARLRSGRGTRTGSSQRIEEAPTTIVPSAAALREIVAEVGRADASAVKARGDALSTFFVGKEVSPGDVLDFDGCRLRVAATTPSGRGRVDAGTTLRMRVVADAPSV